MLLASFRSKLYVALIITLALSVGNPVNYGPRDALAAGSPYAPTDLQAAYALPNWVSRTAMPAALRRHTSVFANGYIFVLGGKTATTVVSTVYSARLNADGSVGTWQTLNPLPQSLEWATAVLANGRIYVIGGDGGSNPSASVFYSSVSSGGTLGGWNSAAALPVPLSEHAAVFANGRLIVAGGITSGSGTPLTGVYTTVVHSDGSLDAAWTTNGYSLPVGLRLQAMAATNGFLLVTGGDDSTGNPTTGVYSASINTDGTVGFFNQQANTLPIPLDSHAMVAWRGNLAVVGGHTTWPSTGPTASVYHAPISASSGSIGNPDCSSGCWAASYNSLSAAVSEESVLVGNNTLVVSGGLNASSVPVSSVNDVSFNIVSGSVTSGAPATVAIVYGYHDPSAEYDLGLYRSTYNLPTCSTGNGCFKQVFSDGSQPANGDSLTLGEYSIDLDIASAICPNCHILDVEAGVNTSIDDLSSAAHFAAQYGNTDPNFAPIAVSNSYGTAEFSGETGADDADFNNPGVAMVAASGNVGYCTSGCSLFPAASRFVIAAGGTYLTSSRTGWSETVWSNNNASDTGVTTSGCSPYETKPSWQTDSACSRRTVADIAVVADGPNGVSIYDSTSYKGQSPGLQRGWGTSVASPMIASMIALTGSGWNSASYLYNHRTALHDLADGTSNGACGAKSSSTYYLCHAVAGYDGPSGVGTPLGKGISAFGPVLSGPTWSQSSPPSSPAARVGSSMAYDAQTHSTVLMGGNVGGTYQNDTWLLSAGNWTNTGLSGPNPARAAGSAMAFDPVHNQVVLFGGYASTGPQNDTWIWDGVHWTQAMPPNPLPEARGGANLVYDPAVSGLLLFGGQGATTPELNDTWVWNGTVWTPLPASPPQPARSMAAMAYDPATGKVVLFGGNSGTNFLNDTWSFDGTNWTLLNPASSPSPRSNMESVFDDITGNVVLFGGQYCPGPFYSCGPLTYYNETWVWDGSTWSQPTLTIAPSGRRDLQMDFDGGAGSVVVFGGYDGNAMVNDTWQY
jgi:Galactose oxidase, central domain